MLVQRTEHAVGEGPYRVVGEQRQDGPGGQLVVLDRIPRAASNPVDDARVESAMTRAEVDRWAADRWVYVTDASLLLEQAAGRLVRSAADRGVVAVLDPRLLKVGPLSYPEPTRKVYLGALAAFTTRTSELVAATDHLATLDQCPRAQGPVRRGHESEDFPGRALEWWYQMLLRPVQANSSDHWSWGHSCAATKPCGDPSTEGHSQ